uniref:Uncharacterized protein n=1 Tax=Anguilla anguilla TaxID=7936 RepID=A0A0E9PZB3_ANGAN
MTVNTSFHSFHAIMQLRMEVASFCPGYIQLRPKVYTHLG